MLPFLPLLPPVTVSLPSAYPNGYVYRRARRIAGAAILGSDAIDGCQLWFDRTDAAFKDVAHGGRVQSSAGWDIRFETAAGVRIPHELELYDPATGRRAGWLTPPTLPPGQDFDLYEYYGNATVAAAEADAPACWANCFASWRMPDGVDMSGQGRSLTVLSVTAGTITGLDSGAGIPAGIFAAASYMELLAPNFFDGAAEWTLAGLLLPGSLPNSASWTRFGGTVAGSARHATWFDPTPSAPGLSNCWAGGYKLSDANNPQLFQPSGSAVAAALQHLAYVARSGIAPSWYRNGLLSPATLVGTVATGSIGIQNGDSFRLGANGGSNPEAVRGKYGRLVLWRQAKSAAFLWLHYLSLLDPDAVMSISDEDAATDPDHAPILAGSFASCAAGSSIDLPLLDHASDPDGTAMAPVVETSPAQGSASAQDSGAVRYSAGSGASGADRFTASANAGGKKAVATVRISIASGGGGGGGNPGAELPTPARTAYVGNQAGDYSSLAAFYAAYNPDTMAGTHLRIRAGMGPQAGINWQKPGRQDAPLVVRADVTPSKNSAGAWVMPRVNGISLNAADVIVWGIDQGAVAIGITGARCRVLRCLFDGYGGGADTTGKWVSVAAPDVLFGYCEMRNGLGRWVSVDASTAPRARLFRGYLHDGKASSAGNTHEVIQVGLQASHRLISAQAIVEAMLLSAVFVGGEEECISNKSSDNIYRFNTLLNCAHLENRHGRRNRYLGNWIEGPSSGLRIMDADHTLLGNYVRGDGLELWAGSCTPDAYVNGAYPSCWKAVAVGNDASVLVGGSYGKQNPVLAVQDALIEKNTGLVTLKKQTGTIQHPTTAYAYPTPAKLAAAEVGIGATWRGIPS